MPTAAFLEAAKKSDRQPVVVLAVESISALKVSCSTPSEWQAAKANTNINVLSDPGTAYLTTDGIAAVSGTFQDVPVAVGLTLDYDSIVDTTVYSSVVSFPDSRIVGTRLTFQYTTIDGGNPILSFQGRKNGGVWSTLYSIDLAGILANDTLKNCLPFPVDITLDKGQWDIRMAIQGQSPGTGMTASFTLVSRQDTFEARYLSSGSIQTPTLDLGLIPSLSSRLEIDDAVPSGCTLTYTGRGSNNGSTWASLGTLLDGDSLPAYRYYDFIASFTSSGTYSPELYEIRVVGGDSQYDYISTHKDLPVQGAKPYILPDGVSSLTNRIDLLKPATTGDITIKMAWRPKTGDMIATGYLKNKAVIAKAGYVGLAEEDFEPFFTGTWYDYTADGTKQEITIKTRDVLKRFNQKVPRAEYFYDGAGNQVQGKTYSLSGNIMQVMLDIADLLGIPDRYLDRPAFTALRDGSRSGSDWNVSRQLAQQVDATELMNELAVSAGVFLVPLPSGKLTAISFDDAIAAAPADNLDAMHHAFKALDGGQKDLSTQCAIFYQLLPGKDGGSNSDYGQMNLTIFSRDGVALSDLWGEIVTKSWYDKWNLSPVALQRIADRFDAWFGGPRATVKVDNLPPRYFGITEGQVVSVDNLQIPCPAASWQGYSVGKKFLVMSRTPDPMKGTISLELYEIGDTTYAPVPTFPVYSALDFFPVVLNLTAVERIEKKGGGVVNLYADVTFTTPTDFHFGSAEVWYRTADQVVWNFAAPLPYGGPATARTYSLPVTAGYTYEIAVITVNTSGRKMSIDDAPKTSIYITPAPLPGDVPYAFLTGKQLVWGMVPGTVIKGYVVRYQTGTNRSFGDAIPMHSGVLQSSPYDLQSLPSGPITIMICAVDTADRFSANPAYIVTDLGDPAVANIVETTDFRALGWPNDAIVMWNANDNTPMWSSADGTPMWKSTLVNGSIVGGVLTADDTGGTFWHNDLANMWTSDGAGMWHENYLNMTYQSSFVVTTNQAGAQLTLSYTADGNQIAIYYRPQGQLPMWSSQSNDPMWSTATDTPMWQVPDFVPWPGSISAAADIYDFIISTGFGPVQGTISQLAASVDVPDINEYLYDVAISAGGTRLPIANTYRVIKYVNITLQDDGGSAVTARVIDKALNGPLIKCFNSSWVATTGHIDAHIQGY